MAVELREDMKAIKAQLTQLNDVRRSSSIGETVEGDQREAFYTTVTFERSSLLGSGCGLDAKAGGRTWGRGAWRQCTLLKRGIDDYFN